MSKKDFKDFKSFFENFQKAVNIEDEKWISENTIFPFIDKDCVAGIQPMTKEGFFDLKAPYSIAINLKQDWKLKEKNIRMFEKNSHSFFTKTIDKPVPVEIDLAESIPDKTIIYEVVVDIDLHLFFTKIDNKYKFFSKLYCPKPQR